MQLLLAHVLEQRAAGSMHDALGHSGRAGGKEDVQRMVEGQLLERDLGGRSIGDEVFQTLRARNGGNVRLIAQVGNDDDALEAWQARRDLAQLLERVDLLSVVEVAVSREEHRRADLAEAVEHALNPEIGRARGESRADTRRGA